MANKGGKGGSDGKKERKKKIGSHVWKNYEAKGDSLGRKNKYCPKCGDGTFLAQHKDRVTCGNCGYMEKS